MTIDETTEFGARVARRLREEMVIWLVSVSANGQPQPSPVWFHWDGQRLLIYSQPDAPKIRHITANPRVAIHFDGDGHGGDIVVLTGTATIDASAPLATAVAPYLDKYRAGIAHINMNPDSFAQTYRTTIWVTPSALRGH